MTYGNGFVMNYLYDDLERVVGVRYNGSTSNARSYYYNGEGGLASVLDTPSGRQYGYEYDTLGRLISELQSQGVTPLLHTWYKYDQANRVLEQYYRVNPAVLSASGGLNTLFDNARCIKYTYDPEDGKLTQMTAPGGNAATDDVTFAYSYDALKRLESRTLTRAGGSSPLLTRSYEYAPGAGTDGSTTHTYVWQGGKLITDCWNTNSWGSKAILGLLYDESDSPYGFLYKSGTLSGYTPYYYVTNLQGDIIGIVDKNGASVASYTYNAWGEVISSSGTMADVNPLRYRGYYYDTETGLYYLQSRYYDA